MPALTKEQALAKAKEYYNKIQDASKNANLPGLSLNEQDITNNINNDKKFERYNKANEFFDNNQKQIEIWAKIKENYPHENFGNGPFDRLLPFYMKTDGSPESEKYNEELAERYYDRNKRQGLYKEIVNNIKNFDIKGALECYGDKDKMIDFYTNHTKDIETLFLIQNISDFAGNAGIDANKFKESSLHVKSFVEQMTDFKTSLYVSASEAFFCVDDDKQISPTDMVSSMMVNDPSDKKYKLFTECVAGMAEYQKNGPNLVNKLKEKNLDIKNLFSYKAVDEKGKQTNLLDAITKDKGKIVKLKDKDINKIFDVKAKSIDYSNDLRIINEWSKSERGTSTTPDKIAQNAMRLKDVVSMHSAKKAPGFFSKLFNTKYNQNYNAEKEAIANGKDKLEKLGFKKDFIDKITSTDEKTRNSVTCKDLRRESTICAENYHAQKEESSKVKENSRVKSEPIKEATLTNLQSKEFVQEEIKETSLNKNTTLE